MELPFRSVVMEPAPGVTFALQRGKSDLVPPVRMTAERLVFELTLRAGDEDPPNFLGPFSQGPRGARFVYVNSGTMAGQEDSCWTRRAKVPLEGITRALLRRAKSAPIEASITGVANDGGPACGTVPLLGGGWRIAAD